MSRGNSLLLFRTYTCFLGIQLKEISLTFDKVSVTWKNHHEDLKNANSLFSDVGSLYVSGKLFTYPSPKPTLTLASHLAQNVGLGDG